MTTKTLLWLSAWGACYFAFAAAIARSTSVSVFALIETGILPKLSGAATTAIGEDLMHRFSQKRLLVVSLAAAVVASGASGIAIRHDLHSASSIEVAWLCCGYFILYFTAARTTYVARFYGTFATHLKLDFDRVYTLDPAHSSQVASIAAVGQRVLLFWVGIVCSVATLYPIFGNTLPWFVRFVVPTASFFSVVFGTIVFLNSEHDIRSVVNRIAVSTLQSTEHEISDLLRRSTLDELESERLQLLTSLHEKIVASGSYRSALVSGLSILVPLFVPVVTGAADLWSKRGKR